MTLDEADCQHLVHTTSRPSLLLLLTNYYRSVGKRCYVVTTNTSSPSLLLTKYYGPTNLHHSAHRQLLDRAASAVELRGCCLLLE